MTELCGTVATASAYEAKQTDIWETYKEKSTEHRKRGLMTGPRWCLLQLRSTNVLIKNTSSRYSIRSPSCSCYVDYVWCRNRCRKANYPRNFFFFQVDGFEARVHFESKRLYVVIIFASKKVVYVDSRECSLANRWATRRIIYWKGNTPSGKLELVNFLNFNRESRGRVWSGRKPILVISAEPQCKYIPSADVCIQLLLRLCTRSGISLCVINVYLL